MLLMQYDVFALYILQQIYYNTIITIEILGTNILV